MTGRRKPQASGDLKLMVDNFCGENTRPSCQPTASHVLGVTHQFVEVDFRRGDKCAGTATALDDALALEACERMACGHQADAMNPGEFTFRIDGSADLQLSAFDSLTDDGLNFLIFGGRA